MTYHYRKQASRNNSALEDILEALSKLSWQTNFILLLTSIISFWGTLKLNEYELMHLDQLSLLLITCLAYTAPLILLVTTAISFSRERSRGATIVLEMTGESTSEILHRYSPIDFEREIANYYIKLGYEVEHKGGYTADGGIDIIVHKEGKTSLVQCKRFAKNYPVGVELVRAHHGVVAQMNADNGIFVTTSSFTPDAVKFANSASMDLVDGNDLNAMIKIIPPKLEPASILPTISPLPQEGSTTPNLPSCPICGGSMILRTAHHGDHAGSQFWGCSLFPKCNGVRSATI